MFDLVMYPVLALIVLLLVSLTRLVMGSEQQRGEAQKKIIYLVIGAILVFTVFEAIKGAVVTPAGLPQSLKDNINLAMSAVQWIGGLCLAAGAVYVGIQLRCVESAKKREK